MAVIIPISVPNNCIDCNAIGIRTMLDCKLIYDGCANCGRHPNCPLKEVPSGKWISVTEIQNMRKEMSTISRVTDGERDILFTCLAMIDDLIEGYIEE